MNHSPLAPEYRSLRRAYLAFYIFALPLFLLVLSCALVIWRTWSIRDVGPIESPQPTKAEIIVALVGAGTFTVCYVAVWLLAPLVTNPRRAWIPFTAHIPALVLLLILQPDWPTLAPHERWYSAAYLAALLALLADGIYLSLRNDIRESTSVPAR
jgi:hypothetical protein